MSNILDFTQVDSGCDPYYPTTFIGGTSGTTEVGLIVAMPKPESRGGMIDTIAYFQRLANGSAGSVVRMGIYQATSSQNLYPNNLIVDGGDLPADSGVSTLRRFIVNAELVSGNLYWVVRVHNSSVALGAYEGNGYFAFGFSNTLSDINGRCGLQKAYVHSPGLPLPTTFPAGAILRIATSAPFFYVRYSS